MKRDIDMNELTPMMQHYLKTKEENPGKLSIPSIKEAYISPGNKVWRGAKAVSPFVQEEKFP